jgi:hypothetical protein
VLAAAIRLEWTMQLLRRTLLTMLLILAPSLGAQGRPGDDPAWPWVPPSEPTLAEIYGSLTARLSNRPYKSDGKHFEILHDWIIKTGFRRLNETAWEYRGKDGRIVLMALLDQGYFEAELRPAAERQFGDASLAGLLNKALLVTVDDGDSIAVRISNVHLVSEGQSGELTESLSFRLAGGAWWRTRCIVKWPKQ